MLLTLHRDYIWLTMWKGVAKYVSITQLELWLTVQKVSGWKNMLTKVSSLMFLARRVDARLSMTVLALKSLSNRSAQYNA